MADTELRKSPAQIRLECWQQLGSGRWGLGVAIDLYGLECRVAALEKAIHDAAPAARASDDRGRTDKADSRPDDGTGDSQEPVAWAVVEPNNEMALIAFKRRDANDRASASDRVVPLYRHSQPPLTDAEREAVSRLACACETSSFLRDPAMAKTLRGLLKRLGGGE